MKDALENLGIKVKGNSKSIYQNKKIERQFIYNHNSEKLNDIVNIINEKSMNLYAELLLNHIGLKLNNTTIRDSSLNSIKTFWTKKGLNTDGLFIYDGSGLSTNNAANVSFFTELLNYMYNDSEYSNFFYNSLPLAGISGTMKRFEVNKIHNGKLRAKSGSMKEVISYAGYIDIGHKKPLSFALIINNYLGEYKDIRKEISQLFDKFY